MSKRNESSHEAIKPSYEVNTMGITAGPLHAALLNYFNEMHEAKALGDIRTIEELEQIVPPLLDEFEEKECAAASRPHWLARKMRAGWHVSCGNFEMALRHELVGYAYACQKPATLDQHLSSDRCRSVSASNIADQMWRLGRAKEGLPWAQLSVHLWPSNTVNHLVLAVSAYHAGLRTEANQIFDEFRRVADLKNNKDVLTQCLSFERELRKMIDLPAIRSLLQEMGE